ncbi:cobalamin-binding protein [Evansella sp. LMS18]|uniref:cobalamin-binding protein n=1 Tax=Evansella sp. LMS18 TaxID=2924033 RepID=UPI0020D04AAD|nr:cobalamin-binding protein [Evansella sp. LMS18]UTR09763.1 cobalamin-binding protein [Evansella sp. LMS18]
MKLISICPSNTELLAYLGLTSSLAGVDDYSDWPEEINDLPRVGPDLNIDMDKVEELNPDLVLASLTVPGMEKNIEELEKRRIPYYIVPNPETLTEVGDQLLLLGELTNQQKAAEKMHDKFTAVLNEYRKLSSTVTKKKSIYWEWWAKPVFTPGAGNWLTEISELAGGYNVFKDKEEASVQTDWEDVRLREPEIIAVVWVGVRKEKVKPEIILKRPLWKEMEAVKKQNLFILEEPLFCRPSPRLLTGLQRIASLAHPDIFPMYKEGSDVLLGDKDEYGK